MTLQGPNMVEKKPRVYQMHAPAQERKLSQAALDRQHQRELAHLANWRKPPRGPKLYAKPGAPALEIEERVIDNPLALRPHRRVEGDVEPQLIMGKINVRESPVEFMHHRGDIDSRLKKAADRFRRFYEAATTLHGVIDPARIRVDTSGVNTVTPDRVLMAWAELDVVKGLLGRRDYVLIVLVCTVGLSINECARLLYANNPGPEEQRHLGRRTKDALNELAEHWGIETSKRPRKPDGKPRFFRSFSKFDLTSEAENWNAPVEQAAEHANRRERKRKRK